MISCLLNPEVFSSSRLSNRHDFFFPLHNQAIAHWNKIIIEPVKLHTQHITGNNQHQHAVDLSQILDGISAKPTGRFITLLLLSTQLKNRCTHSVCQNKCHEMTAGIKQETFDIGTVPPGKVIGKSLNGSLNYRNIRHCAHMFQ